MGTSALTRPVVVYVAGVPSDRYDIRIMQCQVKQGTKYIWTKIWRGESSLFVKNS